jgi:hypothetical protein
MLVLKYHQHGRRASIVAGQEYFILVVLAMRTTSQMSKSRFLSGIDDQLY